MNSKLCNRTCHTLFVLYNIIGIILTKKLRSNWYLTSRFQQKACYHAGSHMCCSPKNSGTSSGHVVCYVWLVGPVSTYSLPQKEAPLTTNGGCTMSFLSWGSIFSNTVIPSKLLPGRSSHSYYVRGRSISE